MPERRLLLVIAVIGVIAALAVGALIGGVGDDDARTGGRASGDDLRTTGSTAGRRDGQDRPTGDAASPIEASEDGSVTDEAGAIVRERVAAARAERTGSATDRPVGAAGSAGRRTDLAVSSSPTSPARDPDANISPTGPTASGPSTTAAPRRPPVTDGPVPVEPSAPPPPVTTTPPPTVAPPPTTSPEVVPPTTEAPVITVPLPTVVAPTTTERTRGRDSGDPPATVPTLPTTLPTVDDLLLLRPEPPKLR